MPESVCTGIVKFYSRRKDMGFVERAEGSDVYFNARDLARCGLTPDDISEHGGDTVEITYKENHRGDGYRVKNMRILQTHG